MVNSPTCFGTPHVIIRKSFCKMYNGPFDSVVITGKTPWWRHMRCAKKCWRSDVWRIHSVHTELVLQTKFEVILTVHRHCYVEIKCQLDATDDIYCRFYCMLNMFLAILCPSSGAREYYTDGRCLWYLVLWFSGCRCDVELKVICICIILSSSWWWA